MINSTQQSYHARQGACGFMGKCGNYREFLRFSTAVLRRWKIAVAVAALGAAATPIASAGTSAVCNAGGDCTQNINTTSYSAPNYGYQPQFSAPQYQVINTPNINPYFDQRGWALQGSPVSNGGTQQNDMRTSYEEQFARSIAQIRAQNAANAAQFRAFFGK